MSKKTGIPKVVRTTGRPKTVKPAPNVMAQVPHITLKQFEGQHDEEMLIAPKDAKRITNHMFWDMRPVRKSRVSNYEQLMRQGFWMPGMTISIAILDGKKYLIDGQHRLFALIEYGKPMRFNIKYYECSTKEQVEHLYQVQDQNAVRTRFDTMLSAGSGEKLEITKGKLKKATAAVGMVYRVFGRAGVKLDGEAWQFCNNSLMQPHILSEGWGDAIRGYFNATNGAMKEMTRASGNLNRSICIAIGLLMFRSDSWKARKFWQGVGNFHRITDETDPRQLAGRYIMSVDMTREGGIPRYKHARSILACWNAYAQNRPLQKIVAPEKHTVKVHGFDYEV